MELKRISIEPKIVEKEAFQIAGLKVHGNPMTIDYDKVWEQFMSSYFDQVAPLSTDGIYYNVYFNTDREDVVDLIAGMSVNYDQSVPKGLAVRIVPASRYAMFVCFTNAAKLTYNYIYNKWFPVSKYEWDKSKPDFEYFSHGFLGKNIPMFIYIPIKKKTEKVNGIEKFSTIEKEQLQKEIYNLQKPRQKSIFEKLRKTKNISLIHNLIYILAFFLLLIGIFFTYDDSVGRIILITLYLLIRFALWFVYRK